MKSCLNMSVCLWSEIKTDKWLSGHCNLYKWSRAHAESLCASPITTAQLNISRHTFKNGAGIMRCKMSHFNVSLHGWSSPSVQPAAMPRVSSLAPSNVRQLWQANNKRVSVRSVGGIAAKSQAWWINWFQQRSNTESNAALSVNNRLNWLSPLPWGGLVCVCVHWFVFLCQFYVSLVCVLYVFLLNKARSLPLAAPSGSILTQGCFELNADEYLKLKLLRLQAPT